MRGKIAVAVLWIWTAFVFLGIIPVSKADDKVLSETRLDARINFNLEEKKIILRYSEEASDVLKGQQIEAVIEKFSHLDGFAASVFVVEMEMDDRKSCTVHSVFVFDAERTYFTAVSCK